MGTKGELGRDDDKLVVCVFVGADAKDVDDAFTEGGVGEGSGRTGDLFGSGGRAGDDKVP